MTEPRHPPDDPREWLNRARSNLRLAAQHEPGIYLEELCFNAHQAAEKAIKGVFIFLRRAVPSGTRHRRRRHWLGRTSHGEGGSVNRGPLVFLPDFLVVSRLTSAAWSQGATPLDTITAVAGKDFAHGDRARR